ncbi:MAG: hypothetical protein P4L50_15930 [Anaerolineaceae bacterium]|nr:hypothetical protein [Anaerolineaceae bacterium]
MSIFDRMIQKTFSKAISQQVSAQLSSIPENDNTFLVNAHSMNSNYDRDRFDYDREEVLRLSLEAWRVNPLARRIVGLISQYVVGGGIVINCKHEPTTNFLNKFWDHRLNHMHTRAVEFCDELSRTGNLFILVSTDSAGMSYVRAIPAADIDTIQAAENDIEQELSFTPRMLITQMDPKIWPAYNEQMDNQNPDGSFNTVMLHYSINKPVGAQWGEPDLAPVLRWLSRYAAWLEDRARLNRFRNAFLYIVKGTWNGEAERLQRQSTLNANPPQPGSILVTDASEEWSVINPELAAADANNDGLALKKMIAAGVGLPLHFLAEPESSTRTTADSAGGPTFRFFEQRQEFFTWMLSDLLQVVLNRRAMVDKKVSKTADLDVNGADISERNNAALATATDNIYNSFSELHDLGLITDNEFLRMVYRFSGETVDIEEVLAEAKANPPKAHIHPPVVKPPVGANGIRPSTTKIPTASQTINPETGEDKQPRDQ